MPLSEYPCPFHAADFTVISAVLAVRVPVWNLLLPTARLPKFIVAGATASCPGGGARPIPDSGTVAVELAASEIIERAPLAEPADVGQITRVAL